MKDIDPELLKRYAHGKCNPREQQLVERWLHDEPDGQSTEPGEEAPQIKAAIWAGLMQKEANSSKAKLSRKLWYISAAALLFLAGSLTFFKTNFPFKNHFSETALIHYTAPKGKIVTLQLPDHSTITLSGGSTIAYPKKFSGQNRTVNFIKGEVFFAIQHEPSRPFFVRTQETEVKVLGTRFNVNLNRDKDLEITLTQGSVSFKGKDQPGTVLKPGQQLSYNLLKHITKGVEQIDTTYIAGWSRGIIWFRETPMQEVLERLEKYYGVTFLAQGNPELGVPLTAKFQHQPLSKVLELIHNSTSIRFKQENNQIIVY